MEWVGLGHFGYGSFRVMFNLQFGSVLGRVPLGVRSKPIVFISDVSSGMDSDCSVQVSGPRSVLPGLISCIINTS